MKKFLPASKGFTLVELMVVITIIAILSIIGITVFTSAQANARDARRRLEINSIASALETNKPPDGNYKALTDDQFTPAGVPVDPSAGTRQYCMNFARPASTGQVATVIGEKPKVVEWPSDKECPVVANVGTYSKVVKQTSPASIADFIGWRVCAYLENGGSDPIYCKQGSQ